MRASRLLRMLLLLQNRGRLTGAQLARELEVTRRTVVRDVDALVEAGLPVVVHRGAKGGIELGFNYRTRLTGLAADEAEALGVLLAQPTPALESLGLAKAAHSARTKLLESFPDGVREAVARAQQQFRFEAPAEDDDVRLAALAKAVRQKRKVRIRATSGAPATIHPVALVHRADGWAIVDQRSDAPIALDSCGDINISALSFS